MKLKTLLSVLLVMGLSACGFHLRGTVAGSSEPLPFANFAVESNNGVMLEDMQTVVSRQSDLHLVGIKEADAVIQITQVSRQKDISAVNLSGSAIEYLLVLQVNGQVLETGKAQPMTVSTTVRRTMDYANNEVLGKNEEEAQMWQDMQADAASQLMRQIRAKIANAANQSKVPQATVSTQGK